MRLIPVLSLKLPMAIGDLVSKLLSGGDSQLQVKVYECAECDETFESAKQEARCQCPECLSNDVTALRTADRS